VTRPHFSAFSRKTANRKKTNTQAAYAAPRQPKTNRPEPQAAKCKSPFHEGNGPKQPFLAFLEKSLIMPTQSEKPPETPSIWING